MTKMTISKSIFTLIALGAFITLLTSIPNTSYATVTSGFVGDVVPPLSKDYGTGGTSGTAGGIYVKLFPVIGDVGQNNHQSHNLFAFDEGQNLPSGGTVDVDILPSGGSGTIPDGTYASHYVFYDPLNLETIEGCVDFDSDIVGVITSRAKLIASDGFQDTATTGANYLSPSARGLESQDTVSIVDNDTICLAFQAGNPGDYIRVLTDFSPLAVDNDGDGVEAELDCDDNDPNNYPGNTEVEDSQDNDCDGLIDEGFITLTQISTPFNSPIGIDHHEPTTSIIVSVNYFSGTPLNFERLEFDGTHVPFSTQSGFTDEVKIATARDDGVNSFAPGTMFTGSGTDGHIVKISPDGTTIDNPWVDLPGNGNGLMRGSLYVDRTGIYNGDLIVVTTGGEVWRIDSSSNPTKLADINVHLEGVITVPDDPKYGPWAGKIIAGAEGQGLIHAFDDAGHVGSWNVGVNVEDIDLIPENENFFGVNFGTSKILGAPASEFDSYEGDILLTQEFHGSSGLFVVSWDGSVFQTLHLTPSIFSAPVGQWEHVTFSTAGIVEIPPLVEICGDEIDNDGDGQIDEGCNTAPVAEDDAISTNEDTSVDGQAVATDDEGDSLTYMLVDNTSNGNLVFNNDGSFTYTPDADYNGPDSLTFKASDDEFDSNIATISIDVIPVNDPPVADDAFFNTKEDTSLNDSVTGSDVDGDTLTFAKATDPANGIITVNSDGTFTYTPNFGFVGTDIFEFTSNDGQINSDSATVAVTVIPLTPIEQKERSLDKLYELIATPGIDKKTTKNLEKSIKDLEKSLDDKFWEDKSTSTLDSKNGHHAIHEEEKSVKDLMKIIEDDKEDQAFLDMVQQVIDRIVKADRTLAYGAIDLAEEFEEQDKVQKELDKASEVLQKGDDKLAEGEFDKAIHHYEKAWKHAQKAMKKAVEE